MFTAQLKCDDGKFVAIKYIPKQAIYDNNAIDKIQLELDLLGKIDHPFSVYCYGAFDAQACIAVVMDFAVGGELYHR